MHRKLLTAVAATLVLAGCGDKPEEQSAPKQQVAKPKTMKEIDPEAYHSNIESAMSEISPEEMANFQKVFLCEMKKNNLSPNPRPIDANYVRALAAHVKANPTVGQQCAV